MKFRRELKAAVQYLQQDTKPQINLSPGTLPLGSLPTALLTGAAAVPVWLQILQAGNTPWNWLANNPGTIGVLLSGACLLLALFLTSVALHFAAAAVAAAVFRHNEGREEKEANRPRTEPSRRRSTA